MIDLSPQVPGSRGVVGGLGSGGVGKRRGGVAGIVERLDRQTFLRPSDQPFLERLSGQGLIDQRPPRRFVERGES